MTKNVSKFVNQKIWWLEKKKASIVRKDNGFNTETVAFIWKSLDKIETAMIDAQSDSDAYSIYGEQMLKLNMLTNGTGWVEWR